MKIFTVVYIDADDGCFPFVHSYRTKQDAVRGVEQAALEDFENMQDPNAEDRHNFEGVEWNEDMSKATVFEGREYWITETALQ